MNLFQTTWEIRKQMSFSLHKPTMKAWTNSFICARPLRIFFSETLWPTHIIYLFSRVSSSSSTQQQIPAGDRKRLLCGISKEDQGAALDHRGKLWRLGTCVMNSRPQMLDLREISSIQKLNVLPEPKRHCSAAWDHHQDKQPCIGCPGTSFHILAIIHHQHQQHKDLQDLKLKHQQEHSMCTLTTVKHRIKSEANTFENVLCFYTPMKSVGEIKNTFHPLEMCKPKWINLGGLMKEVEIWKACCLGQNNRGGSLRPQWGIKEHVSCRPMPSLNTQMCKSHECNRETHAVFQMWAALIDCLEHV